jgi:hypothetical protein
VPLSTYKMEPTPPPAPASSALAAAIGYEPPQLSNMPPDVLRMFVALCADDALGIVPLQTIMRLRLVCCCVRRSCLRARSHRPC